MKVVILAAGYATRLYPLTIDRPKCLLEVGGRTILDAICDKVEEIPTADELILVTNARFYEMLRSWSERASRRIPVRVLNDGTTSNETRLGAIGDLRFALRAASVRSDLLMLASDNLFDGSLKDFTAFASPRKDGATLGLYDLLDPKLASKKYGVLELDAEGRVTGLEEKPEFPKTSLIGMGIYHFPERLLPLVDVYLAEPHAQDAPGHYIRWLVGRVPLYGFKFTGMWHDIGDAEALKKADDALKKNL